MSFDRKAFECFCSEFFDCEILECDEISLKIPYLECANHRIFVDNFKESPEQCIHSLKECYFAKFPKEEATFDFFNVRLTGPLGEATEISQLKASFIGKFVRIAGSVIRLGPVRPVPFKLMFQCNCCSNMFFIKLTRPGYFEHPEKCATKGCNSKLFSLKREKCLYRNYQRIRF